MSALAIENQNILVNNIVDSWHITLEPCDDDVICSSVKYMHIFYPIVSVPLVDDGTMRDYRCFNCRN